MAEPFDELRVRQERLAHLRERGINPYPSATERTHTLAVVAGTFEDLRESQQPVTVAGRVMALRRHGGSTFLTLTDGTATLQCYLKRDDLGAAVYALLDDVDVGDFLETTGIAFTTQRGERSILVSGTFRFLAKALRPLPEKWHGLNDVELRYRKRHLDLIVNDDVRATTLRRALLVRHIRRFLEDRGFLEVETPVLQPIAGGATAKPFATHLNALNLPLYLRVAPELYLKRLLVGGLPKVFEVARCFRNEGIDHAHNPEFTQIELYQAYLDYIGLQQLLEELLVTVVLETVGSLTVRYGTDDLNFSPPYPVQDWLTTLEANLGEPVEGRTDESLRALLRQRDVALEPTDGRGAMLDKAYKKFVRSRIIQPTFLVDHPIELSPLAKRRTDRPSRAERFQLVLGGGIELMNGFSELNDPLDQRERFLDQEQLRLGGDEEAQRLDEEFLEALEQGMPPAAGVGIGIDRLAAVLTNNHSLKEVILFPTLRPKPETPNV